MPTSTIWLRTDCASAVSFFSGIVLTTSLLQLHDFEEARVELEKMLAHLRATVMVTGTSQLPVQTRKTVKTVQRIKAPVTPS